MVTNFVDALYIGLRDILRVFVVVSVVVLALQLSAFAAALF